MPLFSQVLSRLSPRLLRALRLRVFMDRERIRSALPAAGVVAELGCGYGAITSWLAETRPDLAFVGVDIDPNAIGAARRMWPRPNSRFELSGRERFEDAPALVLLLHVLHHVPDSIAPAVVAQAARWLGPGGRLLVEELDSGACGFGVFLDRHVSRSPPVVRPAGQLRSLLEPHFEVVSWERFRRTGIGRVRILAGKRPGPGQTFRSN